MSVYVTKMNGDREPFDERKIFKSCIRAGAKHETAKKIMQQVQKKLYNGISTHDVMKITHDLLDSAARPVAMRYNLKEALAQLSPEFHEFELFITKLFTYNGHKTQHSPIPKIQGYCIDHEIDVVVEGPGDFIALVECKHHYKAHTFTGLDVPMRQWARLKDVCEGKSNNKRNCIAAKEAWVVTNTKFSTHAENYARCRNVRLLGWNFPQRSGINDIIENYKAYPLTILNLTRQERECLVTEDIIDTNDFIDAKEFKLTKAKISLNRAKELKKEINELYSIKDPKTLEPEF
ncbi:MAG: restriction endonuclease [Candidatus Aenigmarchaeota archaeon]|nr:restriction endonuclease [Candidatus Aenigmarchaeota archaeon]